jgi:pyruvate-formate lyase
MPIHSQTQHPSTPVKKGRCYTKNFTKDGGDESVQDRKRETGTHMENSEYLIHDDKESEYVLNDDNKALKQQGENNWEYEEDCKFCRNSFATFAEVKVSQKPDNLDADKYELLKYNNENNN